MAKSSHHPAPKKQKTTLFSFFSKKPAQPPAAKPPGTATAIAAKNVAAADAPVRTGSAESQRKLVSAQQAKLLSRICVGTRLAVLWPDDNEYYRELLRR